MQASVEIQLEFGKFYNVDLFQRGYYQMRCYLRFSPKVLFTTEVGHKSRGRAGNDSSYNVDGHVAKTKIFQILYRREDIDINDVFTFKVDFLVDILKTEEIFKEVDMQLVIEMWFADEDIGSNQTDKFQLLCFRCLKLNFDPLKGLHCNLSLLFDYFHLSAAVLTVHASLLAFKQPAPLSLMLPKSSKQSLSSSHTNPSLNLTGLELALFGTPIPPNSSNKNIIQAQKLRKLIGCQKHHLMCRYLLSAYESVQSSYELLLTCVPPRPEFKIERLDCVTKLEELVLKCKNLSEMLEAEEEDVLQVVNSDLMNLNTQLSNLWAQYLELVTSNSSINYHLAKENHSLRTKRFAEGFFVREFSKHEALGCFDAGQHRHADISAKVRLSEYFHVVPSLPVECLETDGDHATLPIIFEDVYSNVTLPPDAVVVRSNSTGTSNDNGNKKSARTTMNRWSQRNNSLRKSAAKQPSVESNNNGNSNNNNNENASNTSVIWTTKTSSSISTVPSEFSLDAKVVLRRDRSTNSTSSQESETQHNAGNNGKKKRISKFRPESLLLLGTGSSWQQQQQQLRGSGLDYRGEQVAFDAPDCRLVGYKKKDPNQDSISSTVELGTFVKDFVSDSTSNDGISSRRKLERDSSARSSADFIKTGRFTSYLMENNGDVLYRSDCINSNNNNNNDGDDEDSNDGNSNRVVCAGETNGPHTGLSSAISVPSSSSSSSLSSSMSSAPTLGILLASTSTRNASAAMLPPSNDNAAMLAPSNDNAAMLAPSNDNAAAKALSISPVQHHLQTSCFLFNASSLPTLNDEDDEEGLATPILNESCLLVAGGGGGSLPELVGGTTKGGSDASGISRSECLESVNVSQKPTPLKESPFSTASIRSYPSYIGKYNTLPLRSPKPAVSQVPSAGHVAGFHPDVRPSVVALSGVASLDSNSTQKPDRTGKVVPGGPVASTSGAAGDGNCPESCEDGASRALQLLTEEYEKSKQTLRQSLSKMPDLGLDEFDKKMIFDETTSVAKRDEDDGKERDVSSVQSLGEDGRPSSAPSSSGSRGGHPRRESRSVQISSHFHSQLVNRRLVSKVTDLTVKFSHSKENLRKVIGYQGHFYSDYLTQISEDPYFWTAEKPLRPPKHEGVHLIICVHGLDGNSTDLRLVRTYLEMSLSSRGRVDFLMSERNQADTFSDFEVMTDRLVQEILYHIDLYSIKPARISFIGHSLGNIIIRSALSRKEMAPLLPKLHTFLSLSGPHLGMLFNNSGLVNMGIWLMQKWKKSTSLLQLSLKDHHDPRQTFMYRLSQKQGLKHFRNVLLVGSQQDRYVPFHSSRMELCKAALRDTSGMGSVYTEMVTNLLRPIIDDASSQVQLLPSSVRQSHQSPPRSAAAPAPGAFVRYNVFHALTSNTNNLIGRAAHIAVLDSELFIEKFISVSVLKYFL